MIQKDKLKTTPLETFALLGLALFPIGITLMALAPYPMHDKEPMMKVIPICLFAILTVICWAIVVWKYMDKMDELQRLNTKEPSSAENDSTGCIL